MATGTTDKTRLEIGQMEIIGPLIPVYRKRVAGSDSRAVDQDDTGWSGQSVVGHERQNSH